MQEHKIPAIPTLTDLRPAARTGDQCLGIGPIIRMTVVRAKHRRVKTKLGSDFNIATLRKRDPRHLRR